MTGSAAQRVDEVTMQRMMDAVRALPQAAVIEETVARAWLERMLQAGHPLTSTSEAPGIIDFHIRRLAGLGASEIITAVMGRRGEFYEHQSQRDVVAQKLMMATPDADTVHTRRGRRAEPIIRERFLSATGARSRRDLVDRLIGFRHPEHPWMVGTPDDVVEIGGRLWIPDYKAPAPSTVEEYTRTGYPLSWDAQVHQYRMMAEAAGIEVTGMLIAMWDPEEFDVRILKIEHVPELDREIVEAGNALWNDYVLQGRLPPVTFREPDEIEWKIPTAIRELTVQAALYEAIQRAAAGRIENCRTRLKDWAITEVPLGNHKLKEGIFTWRGKLKVDEEALVNRAQALGVEVPRDIGEYDVDRLVDWVATHGGDPETMRKPGPIRIEEALEAIKEAGGDPEALKNQNITLALPSKGREREVLESLVAEAQNPVDLLHHEMYHRVQEQQRNDEPAPA